MERQHAGLRERRCPIRFGSDDAEREWQQRAAAVRRLARVGSYVVAPDVRLQTRRGVLVGRADHPLLEVSAADFDDQVDDEGRIVVRGWELLLRAVERGEVLEGL